MEKVWYQDMLPHEIVARRKKFPVAFVPVGILEWHGEHLAVGNDGLIPEKLCELAAAQSGGFAFPTVWYGGPRTVGLMDADLGGPRHADRPSVGAFCAPYLGLTQPTSLRVVSGGQPWARLRRVVGRHRLSPGKRGAARMVAPGTMRAAIGR